MLRKKSSGAVGLNSGSIGTIINDCFDIVLLTKGVKRWLACDYSVVFSWKGNNSSGGLKNQEGYTFVEPTFSTILYVIAYCEGACLD